MQQGSIQFVYSFYSIAYLGSLITNGVSSSHEITSSIAKLQALLSCLPTPLFRKHRISIITKINMYPVLIVSVLFSVILSHGPPAHVCECVCSGSSILATKASVNVPCKGPTAYHLSYDNAAKLARTSPPHATPSLHEGSRPL